MNLASLQMEKCKEMKVFMAKMNIPTTEPYLKPNSSSNRLTSNMSLAMSSLVATKPGGLTITFDVGGCDVGNGKGWNETVADQCSIAGLVERDVVVGVLCNSSL